MVPFGQSHLVVLLSNWINTTVNNEPEQEKPNSIVDDEINVFVQDQIIIKFLDTDELILQRRG